jgi:sugar phosphate isomerase/epimerase
MKNEMQYIMFSKHIQNMPIEQAAKGVLNAGLHGIDLTVRPGGHVEPADVQKKLPQVVDEFKNNGVDVVMISTGIKSASESYTEAILETAASLGIKYYKLGYYPYEGFGTLDKQRKTILREFDSLASLNDKYGITGGYHNHSADFFGAALWDIFEVIKDFPKEVLGFYFDPAHAGIEGGSNGWMMGMELLAKHIVMLAIKDYRWVVGKHRYAGGRKHSVEICPLEQGNVPWDLVNTYLNQINFNGPISFHGEYQGSHCFADLTELEVLKQTKNDVAYFKQQLEPAESK